MDRFEKESIFQCEFSAGEDGRMSAVDEDAACSVCGSGDIETDNNILFCDLCNIAVHQVNCLIIRCHLAVSCMPTYLLTWHQEPAICNVLIVYCLLEVIAGHAVPQDTHLSGILKHLLWLPIEQHIKFKLATLTHNTLCSTQPAYHHSLLNYHTPTRSLRCANTNLLSVSCVCSTFASCGFSVAAPTVWTLPHLAFTTLPLPILSVTFLKLTVSSRPSALPSGLPKCLRFGHRLTFCTIKIYLLTYSLSITCSY